MTTVSAPPHRVNYRPGSSVERESIGKYVLTLSPAEIDTSETRKFKNAGSRLIRMLVFMCSRPCGPSRPSRKLVVQHGKKIESSKKCTIRLYYHYNAAFVVDRKRKMSSGTEIDRQCYMGLLGDRPAGVLFMCAHHIFPTRSN